MTDLAATVLVPTHEHSELLPYAARSALRQTVADLELFIVEDGVEDDTREVVARLEAGDDRVRFFDMPKRERLGEAYRGPILREARGRVVCYLADDDLWLPDHVETMLAALAEADFVSATTLCYRSEDELDVLVHDLTSPFYRELLLSGHSRVPLSAGGPHDGAVSPASLRLADDAAGHPHRSLHVAAAPHRALLPARHRDEAHRPQLPELDAPRLVGCAPRG